MGNLLERAVLSRWFWLFFLLMWPATYLLLDTLSWLTYGDAGGRGFAIKVIIAKEQL